MEKLQLRLLEKQFTTSFFFILGQKGHFFSKNGGTIKKKVITLNMYIGTNVLGGNTKKGSHVYFLLQVFWIILLFDINVVLMLPW